VAKNTICLWYDKDAEAAARFYAEIFPDSAIGAVHRAPSDYPCGKEGGQESQCGWCKDKWGVSWQITPRVLTEALAAGGDEAKRAFDAMMGMKKIDVTAIEAARRG
jgi:predicted 3-demethylubiquinone-9 3-methyltransferase (glyoxalase superfamily)